MGCTSSDFTDYMGMMCSPYGTIEAYRAAKLRKDLEDKIKLLPSRGVSMSLVFSKDPTFHDINFNEPTNIDLRFKILQENERLVPLLKAKLDQLRRKQNSQIIMIGKADCGKPCYAYNRNLFTTCPKCNREVKENFENGTYQKQVYDDRTGQYKWEDFYNEDNICLYFTFNEKVDKCDIDFNGLCDFFDKEDKEKTVHWSFTDKNKTPVEKDRPIHYMMIDGERFDFPYGLQMKEYFFMNDSLLFPVEEGWKQMGYCFSLFDKDTLKPKIGKSIGYWGVKCLHFVIYFECVSCKLQYHVIRTCPLMHRDKSKDPK